MSNTFVGVCAVVFCYNVHNNKSPGPAVQVSAAHYMLGGGIQMEMGVMRSQMRLSPWRPRRTCWQHTGMLDSRLIWEYGWQSALVTQYAPANAHRR